MTKTNFHLAPPAKNVGNLLAVPIDIQSISAKLSFDGAANISQGDATIQFTTGPVNGNPIFDLRQTITGAWLDGIPLPVTKLAHHNFGGGADAELRITESVLAAGSTHSLRVTYSLGLPQASSAGSYQPTLAWSTGPRLVFNFGFTDLGAGRYLEAWVPANLIFDQFALDLELQVLNTPIAHSLITNGQVTVLGPNHWRAGFPEHSTAFSPLVELRATDTLASMSGATTLPVSGRTVSIEAWKLSSNPIDLGTQINRLKGWLADNEKSTGTYLHNGRFVAFLHQGGMEYDGGTTSSSEALQHETFHSWWARGLKPASQPDAWFDEAWAVYNDRGSTISIPFDFTDPPVELCPQNPWIRHTAFNSYDDGNRFWEGVAALIGATNLCALMGEFYRERNARPVTTTDLEEFLVCRTGTPQLVNAFHRFVYGFGDPSPMPDLWLRDDSAHSGSEAWAGRFWDSPDLWIRNSDDGGTTHESPKFGQDNWFHARLRNRSATATARHFLVTFNVKAFAGIEFSYPADFLPCVAAVSGFELAPGASRIVRARWPSALVPSAGTHACLLASVFTRSDHPIPGRHVWEHNNLTQKNLSIVDLKPGAWTLIPVVVANFRSLTARRIVLELVRPPECPDLEVGLVHPSTLAFPSGWKPQSFSLQPAVLDTSASRDLDCAGHVDDDTQRQMVAPLRIITSDDQKTTVSRLNQGLEVCFPHGRVVQIPLTLRPQEQRVYYLRISTPHHSQPGETIQVDLVGRNAANQRLFGGIAIEVRVH